MEDIQNTQMTEEIVLQADPITLDLDDNELVQHIDNRIQDYKDFEEERNLSERRKKINDYVVGKQLDLAKLKKYQVPYIDNVIFESLSTIKPIALSRVPDLIVTPGKDTEESREVAKELSGVMNSEIRERENRQVLGLAFKQRPRYFLACIKYRWDPELGEHGDYKFEVVHPDRLILDPSVNGNNVDEMDFIGEYLDLSVKDICIRFPEKKEEFLKELGFKEEDQKNGKKMATKVRIVEMWFTWYEEKEGDYMSGQKKEYERIEGVCWKYKNCILHKMKNPNWDWEGEKRYFSYDGVTNEKKDVSEDQIREAIITQMMGGVPELQGYSEEQVFNNYFKNPEKPYILIGYHNNGDMPIDETSEIEQVIILQDNVNKRGRQITEMADESRIKHIFSKESGFTKEDIEQLDMGDTDQDLLIDGDIRKAHGIIQGQLPSAPLFQDQEKNKDRIYSIMKTHSTTRGEKETDVATLGQILREADYGVIDDMVEDTINFAAEKMARAAMQMIKLRYTEDHFKKAIGKDGDVVFTTLNRDLIEDGMEVKVHASGVDKQRRQNLALNMAKLQMIDPLTFFEDLDVSQPKERATRLLMFTSSPEQYMSKYIMGLENTEQMAKALNAPEGGQGGAINQELAMAIAQIEQGQLPQVPQNVTPEFIQGFQQWVETQAQQLPPEIQQVAKQYGEQLLGVVQSSRQV